MQSVRMAVVRPSTGCRVWFVGSLVALTASACVSPAPAESSPPSNGITVLSCQDVIGSEAAPSSDFSIVLDRVALPTDRGLQANRSGESDPTARLFAKEGLLVRRGTSFDLVVPEDWRGRLTIGWGSPAKRTSHLRVPGCRPTGTINQPHYRASDEWLAYAGGYWVPEPNCVSVVVRAGQTEHGMPLPSLRPFS